MIIIDFPHFLWIKCLSCLGFPQFTRSPMKWFLLTSVASCLLPSPVLALRAPPWQVTQFSSHLTLSLAPSGPSPRSYLPGRTLSPHLVPILSLVSPTYPSGALTLPPPGCAGYPSYVLLGLFMHSPPVVITTIF